MNIVALQELNNIFVVEFIHIICLCITIDVTIGVNSGFNNFFEKTSLIYYNETNWNSYLSSCKFIKK